jgi:hypothetical protein
MRDAFSCQRLQAATVVAHSSSSGLPLHARLLSVMQQHKRRSPCVNAHTTQPVVQSVPQSLLIAAMGLSVAACN